MKLFTTKSLGILGSLFLVISGLIGILSTNITLENFEQISFFARFQSAFLVAGGFLIMIAYAQNSKK